MSDHALAHLAAEQAGELLLDLRVRAVAESWPPERLKDEGDRLAHESITALLRERRPDDAVLSEEGQDDKARLRADRVWIVDPLDGTREFGEPPRDDWAVHVALWERGADDLTVGAVAMPGLGPTFATAGPGDDTAALPTLAAPATPPRIVVSRTRPPHQSEVVAQALGGQLVPMGSAGAKVMAVVRGRAEVYVHDGGQYEWDSAAPVAIARQVGLHTSRLDGSPLRYNQDDVYLPDLLICHPDLAKRVLAALEAAPSA